MASTKTNFIGQWDTFHNNGPFPTKILLDTRLEPEGNLPSATDRYNDAAKEIQRLIRDCITNNEGFRAYGSAWSLSDIAHQKDRMHYNARMNLKLDIIPADCHKDTSFKPENLFFFQCGNTVKEISEYLSKHGKSLKASGASNGQTIAGCISTGVHGSAFDTGAMPDYVVGLNIIIGPGNADIVYLERLDEPALSDDFAAKINARVIRHNGLFDAALVGLGSFGFIHGVVIEAEDRFLLKKYTRKITREQALELAHTLNFKDSSFKIPGETEADGSGKRPFHFKVYFNPYNDKEDFVAEIIYKKEYRSAYPDPVPKIKTAIYTDLPDIISRIAANHNRLIPKLIKAMRGNIFPALDQDIEGTLGEIFWDSFHQGPAFAYTFGIDNKDAGKALDLFIKLVNEQGPIPGAMALRFIKASKATLAFTRFPMTCIVEMDGILWKGNKDMISPGDFERKMIEAFMAAGIKFTIHWGKNADWAYPGLITYMYGDKAETWKNYRSALLTKQMADIFSNGFLARTGLAEYRPGPAIDLKSGQIT
jgi:hypothetical protein